jgi:hypothetical protein
MMNGELTLSDTPGGRHYNGNTPGNEFTPGYDQGMNHNMRQAPMTKQIPKIALNFTKWKL